VQFHDETVNLRQFFDSARGTPLAMVALQEVNMKSRLIATRCIVPALLVLQLAGAQIREPVVARSSVWIDTVKRGDMVREVRGLGQLRGTTGSLTAVLKIAAAQAGEIKVGQAAQIDTGRALVAGRVAGVGPAPIDGMVDVEIKPSNALPDGAIDGTAVDGTVVIERLQNILQVGRPIAGGAGSTVELFRLEPGGDYGGPRARIIWAKLSQSDRNPRGLARRGQGYPVGHVGLEDEHPDSPAVEDGEGHLSLWKLQTLFRLTELWD
jgi:hypothetical protein